MTIFKRLYPLASPKIFYELSAKCSVWLWLSCALLALYGLFSGLILAPSDYQQGDAFRIIYIHVPCAVMSLGVYFLIALYSSIYLIWHIKIADILAKVSIPIGCSLTFLALITGSLWGKPMWGTWWIWDARLTSELILLFLYLGAFALRSAILEPDKAARASSILVLIGVIDLPIIHYSVYWWNTLHQKASVLKFARPSIAPSMLFPLLAMLLAFALYYFALLLMRARIEIIKREQQASWVRKSIF